VTVLVLRALGLGDLLTAVPALRGLAKAIPEHERVLATTAPLADFAVASGLADRVVAVEPLGPLPRELSGVEVAVNLHGRGPESHRLLLDLQPRRIVGFGNASAGVPGPTWTAGEHEVQRWCRMLRANGISADPADLDLHWPGGEESGVVIIHPGAAFPSRRWPSDRWAAVAAALAADGTQVVVTGSAGELPLARAVVEQAGLPPEACLAGTTDLSGLAALVAGAGLVVSGDTGVAHLATAFGRPSVVLFGPVSPAEWGPPPDRRQHVALWHGRRGDPHGAEVDPGLLAISVDEVLTACRRAAAAPVAVPT